jgi:serine/threonine-protein kinase RsbW
MEEFYLRFPAQIRYLHLATNLCRQLCAKVPKERKVKDFVVDIELCISEACTNAIKHGGRGGSDDFISVRFLLFPELIRIQIGDTGAGFDPEDVPEPDPEILSEKGYGLYIIKTKMDEVHYVRSGEGNYLEMTKFFNKSAVNRSPS